MLVCAGCIRWYTTKGRAQLNPFLHILLPAAGIVLFFLPLYFQYVKYPPTYPFKYANWVALAWAGLGVLATIYIVMAHPEKLDDVDRVYVEDETVETPGATAPTVA